MNPCLRKPSRLERNLVISLLSFFFTVFILVVACNNEPKEKKDNKVNSSQSIPPKESNPDTGDLYVQ